MVINNWVVINNKAGLTSNAGLPALPVPGALSSEALYTAMQCSYAKFYKMDKLCKWAWVATEYLLKNNADAMPDKNNVAVVLGTAHGCIDVDKRYQDGIALPSPALFVYTLPNIMLGEICIRHGLKGEQLCTVNEKFDAEELYFSVSGLLGRGMEACLCGWVDVWDEQYDICLFWVTKKGSGAAFTPVVMHQLYSGAK